MKSCSSCTSYGLTSKKKEIASFKRGASNNVFGFSEVHVLKRSEWHDHMFKLAQDISPRSKVEPIAAIYEIMMFCGMNVLDKSGSTLLTKKSLEQDSYVYSDASFAANKHRANCSRRAKDKTGTSTVTMTAASKKRNTPQTKLKEVAGKSRTPDNLAPGPAKKSKPINCSVKASVKKTLNFPPQDGVAPFKTEDGFDIGPVKADEAPGDQFNFVEVPDEHHHLIVHTLNDPLQTDGEGCTFAEAFGSWVSDGDPVKIKPVEIKKYNNFKPVKMQDCLSSLTPEFDIWTPEQKEVSRDPGDVRRDLIQSAPCGQGALSREELAVYGMDVSRDLTLEEKSFFDMEMSLD